jgi:glucose/mannose-6-phosphate isomerase
MTEQSILDQPDEIQALDEQHTLESAGLLAMQIEDTWQQIQNLTINVTQINHIVVTGMGGSALGAHVVRSVFKHDLPAPLTIVNHYSMPGFVNENTLVICASYSGTTEETLAAMESAMAKKAQIVVMATGGDLIQKAMEHNLPYLHLQVNHNPSGQPRMAIGYMVTALIGILAKANCISIQDQQIADIVEQVKQANASYITPTDINLAKKLAFELFDKIIFLVSADHLTGAFHVLNNQLNENAKQLTVELHLPELNHHYMEALSFPKFVPNQGVFLFADSTLYHPRNRTRVALTREVVENAGFMSATISLTAKDSLGQAFEAIQIGMYTNLYLAFLNGVNPAPIPNVDYFKEKLGHA